MDPWILRGGRAAVVAVVAVVSEGVGAAVVAVVAVAVVSGGREAIVVPGCLSNISAPAK